MSVFFRPYEGKRPYLFISYSHRDSEKVLDAITRLDHRRLRLWYDEGIPAGSDWPANIERHMRDCAAVLFFRSVTALASPNCFSEIKTAVSLGKPLWIVQLDHSPVPDEWATLIGQGTLLSSDPEAEKQVEAVLGAKRIGRAFYRKWTEKVRWDRIGLALSLLLFLAASLGLWQFMNGYFDPWIVQPTAQRTPRPTPTASPTPTPEPTASPTPIPTPDISAYEGLFKVEFPDRQQERAVQDALGHTGEVQYSELFDVAALYFCGHMTLDAANVQKVHYADGAIRVGKGALGLGSVSDLGVLGRMSRLERLALIRQPVSDLSALDAETLVLLGELSLAGCEQVQIGTLPALPSLETLHLEFSGVRDLTALSGLPRLRRVTVSPDMLPLTVDSEIPYLLELVTDVAPMGTPAP